MSDTEPEWYPSDDEEIVIANKIPVSEYDHWPPHRAEYQRFWGGGGTVVPERNDPGVDSGVVEMLEEEDDKYHKYIHIHRIRALREHGMEPTRIHFLKRELDRTSSN